MIKPLIFISPLSPPDCTRRLEKLVEKKHFHFSSGRFIVHIKIDSIETSRDSFNLFVCCNPERFRLPAFMYFKLIGEVLSTENGAAIRMRLQLHKPFSKFEWVFIISWLLILVLAIIGGIISILSSPLLERLFIGLVFALAGIGYAWELYQTYKLGMAHIPKLVYTALRQDMSAKSQQEPKTPDWVSSLSESQ